MKEINIRTENIRLDHLLKLEGIINTGGQVRLLLNEQKIIINGEAATERRKKIYSGDVIEIRELGAWTIIKS